MLKNQIMNLISSLEEGELFNEELEYAKNNGLLNSDKTVIEKSPELRFADAYIERVDKESEEMIRVEGKEFLNQPIHYLKENMKEFIYLESNWFEIIGVDAVSLEVDDLFGTYDVMLGLKLKKNMEPKIKSYLTNEFGSDDTRFDLMFSSDDGLWNLNFDLDHVHGFKGDMSVGQAYQLIYHFLFKLVESIEIK